MIEQVVSSETKMYEYMGSDMYNDTYSVTDSITSCTAFVDDLWLMAKTSEACIIRCDR